MSRLGDAITRDEWVKDTEQCMFRNPMAVLARPCATFALVRGFGFSVFDVGRCMSVCACACVCACVCVCVCACACVCVCVCV